MYNLRAILTVCGSLSGWFLARKPSSDDQKLRRPRRDFQHGVFCQFEIKTKKGGNMSQCRWNTKERNLGITQRGELAQLSFGGIPHIDENAKHVRRRRRYATQNYEVVKCWVCVFPLGL